MHSKKKCRFLLAFYFFIRTFAEENGNSGNAEFFFKPINSYMAVPLFKRGHAKAKEMYKNET